MSTAAAQLRELAEPWAGGEKIKSVIDRAARRAGLTYWRAFDIWYGKARRIETHEIEQIEDALAEKKRAAVRNELHDIRLRLSRLEAMLSQTDSDFHRDDIEALSGLLRSRKS